jgi:glutamyl-tRNA synthetase/glutamyl-Q tRNA(Asp) synthetase
MPGIIRFAPSPTGFLHEGHLLSALYVWAAAKKWDLKIHLRIEDHDQGRARQEYIDSIYEDLAWLGFKYDNQSIQSSHFNLFQEVLDKLCAKGLVYPCTCSRKTLLAENPISNTGEVIYQGKCFHSTIQNSVSHNLRIHIPDKVISWCDERLGDFSECPKLQCGDFPIRDRDGYWTYQFAVCIDDLTQGITHIVRGEDILTSTARQILLSEIISDACTGDISLNIPPYSRPLYLHHPLIVDSTGKKLSKREHAHSIRQDKDDGITPEQLLGRILHKAKFQPESTPVALEKAIALVAEKM